jgi:tetratricopeptide (TPR) repeat protein
MPRPRPRARRAAFILLFGTKTKISIDPASPPVTTRCPRCGQSATFTPKFARDYFTVFFLPLFPISAKKPFSQCGNCGAAYAAAPAQMRQAASQDDAKTNQRAIAMYNSLRNSPANSVTLQELMHTYATLGDYDAALSAAQQFPQALNNSEQCIVTLGRVHLAKADPARALTCFDQALARNPALPDAHYFKALAHFTSTPPDYDRAIASARAARNAGHEDADRLLKDAESRRRNA